MGCTASQPVAPTPDPHHEERMRPSKGDLAPGSPAAQVVIAGVSSATPSPSSAHPAIVIAQPDDIQPHAIDEVPLMSLDPDVAALKIQAHARRLQASKRVDALKQQKERDRLQAEEQRRRRDETASAIKIQSIARRRGAQRAVEGIRKQVSLHPLETVDPTDSSVELYHRGHKLGLFGYCTVSVVDTGSGFAVRVYCPSTCQTLTTSFTCTSAAEAVGTSADLKEYSVVAEKLASRLFVTESGHLDLLLTTEPVESVTSATGGSPSLPTFYTSTRTFGQAGLFTLTAHDTEAGFRFRVIPEGTGVQTALSVDVSFEQAAAIVNNDASVLQNTQQLCGAIAAKLEINRSGTALMISTPAAPVPPCTSTAPLTRVTKPVSPPIVQRGVKFAGFGYYRVSVYDTDTGFEFRVFDPRACRQTSVQITLEEAVSLVSHDPSLSRDSVVLCYHLIGNLSLDGFGKPVLLPGQSSAISPPTDVIEGSEESKLGGQLLYGSRKVSGEYLLLTIQRDLLSGVITITSFETRRRVQRSLQVSSEMLAELAPSTTLVAGFNEVASFLLSRLSIVGDELALTGASSRLPIVDQENDKSSANSKLSKATKVSGQYCVINMSGSPTLITSSVWCVKTSTSLSLSVPTPAVVSYISQHHGGTCVADGLLDEAIPSTDLLAFLAERLQITDGKLTLPHIIL